MIEFAKRDDYINIIKLWNICFGDDEIYIRKFLEKLFTPNNCLIYTVNSEIYAMLFLLSGNVVSGGNRYSSYYVYAACTVPEFRKRGFMSKLVEYAVDYSKLTNTDFLCLVPANDHLFDYYFNLGFKKAFKRKDLLLDRSILNLISDKQSVECFPSAQEIRAVREKSLSLTDYFSWGTDVIEYSIAENENLGGTTVYAKCGDDLVGYALFFKSNEKIIIKEFCALNGHIGSVINMLLNSSNEEKFYFSIPVDFPVSSDNLTVRDNGMALPISAHAKNAFDLMKNAYIGLTLE